MGEQMKPIILVSAKQRAGKDFFSDLVTSQLLDFNKRSSALEVKKLYSKIKNLTLEEVEEVKTIPKVRAEIIKLAEDKKLENIDFWIKDSALPFSIVSDWRFLSELNYVERNLFYPIIKVRIEATKENREKRGTLSNEDHYSETELDDFPHFNYIIENNDTKEEFIKRINEIIIPCVKTDLKNLQHLKHQHN